MSKPLIIYHGGCPDGFCSALIAWKNFKGEADFHPGVYGEPHPDVEGRDVYILDFSYKRPVMREILAKARSVVVIDHHKTAEAELDGIVEEFLTASPSEIVPDVPWAKTPVIHFDMERSGAMLTWRYFYPDKEPPHLVHYVQDRDLWRWELDRSREVNSAISSYPMTFEAWDGFLGMRQADFVDGMASQGHHIERAKNQLVEIICKQAYETTIGGYKVLAVNATAHYSEVAGRLAEGRPFGAAWFVRKDGKRQWSFRSDPGGIDVSELARQFGGGGHRHAAGVEEPIVSHSIDEFLQ